VYENLYHLLGNCDAHILFTMLRCRSESKCRINRCHAVTLEAEGGDCVRLYWAAGEGGVVLVLSVRAFKWDGVAASGCGFVIHSFNPPLVSTAVGITGGGGRADGAGGGSLFRKLSRVAKLAAVSTLGDE